MLDLEAAVVVFPHIETVLDHIRERVEIPVKGAARNLCFLAKGTDTDIVQLVLAKHLKQHITDIALPLSRLPGFTHFVHRTFLRIPHQIQNDHLIRQAGPIRPVHPLSGIRLVDMLSLYPFSSKISKPDRCLSASWLYPAR